ncbi:MAG: helix-turn-helix transcriptional regulator [Thermoplasmata archaeon]
MTPNLERGRGDLGEVLARGRVLALIVAAGSIALVGLLLLLPLTMEHAFEGAQLLLWGSLLLIVTLIIGISLVYAYISKYVGESKATDSRVSRGDSPGTDSQVEITLELLPVDERSVYRRLLDEGGQVLQKDLRQMVSFSGPKISRVLDRLEGKGLVVRERHGMTNRVRLTERPR